MRIISLIILSTLSLSAHALKLDELYGCFDTIAINMAIPQYGPDAAKNQTTFEEMGNHTYKDPETNLPMSISVLNFFKGYNGPYYTYSPIVIFPNHGRLIEEENLIKYSIDKDVMIQSHGIYKKIDHKLDIEIGRKEKYLIGTLLLESRARGITRVFSFQLLENGCLERE